MNEITELDEFIGDLRDLVSFRTVVCENPGEFRKANEWIRTFFAGSGVEFIEFRTGQLTSTIIKPTDSVRPSMIGDGHIEVVPASPGQFTLRRRGGKLWGRGTADMKTQVLAMMHVMRSLVAAGQHHDFWLVLTEDEEVGSQGGAVVVIDHLVGEGLLPPVVFAPDGGPNFGYVEKEKGIATFTVTSKGVAAHASRPYLATNPIDAMFDLAGVLKDAFPDPVDESDWRPSIAMTGIGAGTASNRIPAECRAVFDLRFTEEESPRTVRDTIESLVGRFDASVSFEKVEPTAYYPKEAPAARRFLRLLEDVSGTPPPIIHSAGASNGRHYAAAGDVHVLMSNPMACGAHGEAEWVSEDSLLPYIDLVHRTATIEA